MAARIARQSLNAAPAEEELKGSPRSIRLDALESGRPETCLQAFLDYFPGAKLRQSQSFHPDGGFSYFLLCEYAEDGRLSKESIYWQGVLHTERLHLPQDKDGAQVTVTRSAAGQELERIATRYNDAGQPIECTNISDTGEAHLSARYDEQGNFLDARATLPDGTEVTFPMEIDPAYKIVTRDAIGNWTEKTTPFATLYRTIQYYS
jgi:hypothetical protein